MKVLIPAPLRSYTGHQTEVEASGANLEEVLRDLDRRYPGLRFRIVTEQDTIRRHIRIFVNQNQAEQLTTPVQVQDQVQIICALSGG